MSPGDDGLASDEALARLSRDVRAALAAHRPRRRRLARLLSLLRASDERAACAWPSLCALIAYGLCCSIAGLHAEGAAVWALVALQAALAGAENALACDEIARRARESLDAIELARRGAGAWRARHYPHPCAPASPCVTLQWTRRDGRVVNLPWALLVEGDVVAMKPGQEAPGECVACDDAALTMSAHQTYQPAATAVAGSKTDLSAPRAMRPHKTRLFRMTETPYVNNLKLALDKSLKRPVTVHEKQRHLVMIKCIESFFLPASVILVLMASFIRYIYLSDYVGIAHWTTIFLLQVVATTLPLLPIMFPFVWLSLNVYGLAKFKFLLQQNNVSSEADPQSDNDRPIWKIFFSILLGRENFVSRTANIVQVLGSVTALCCVDKKGILSWPNPTPEKVFFLRNSTSISRSSSKSSFMETMSHLSANNTQELPTESSGKQNTSLNTTQCMNTVTVAEVLDLTHDQNIPFGLEFDDSSWKNHISSLKPLGLAILLNTCNMDTQEHYCHFCAHLTCEATQSEDVVPVTNRRCLCELAKQIGFADEAKAIYSLQNNLATYRHLPPDVIRRDTKFARSLHLTTRVKVPLPHMLSVIIKDHSGGLQLMSQGTADIILDSCVEYWNGQDLCTLTPSERKKVLDFYQRSSLTAYCSAFAYRPLTQGISPQLASMFLELPIESSSVYPTNTCWNESSYSIFNNLYHSTDSLLFSDVKDEDVTDVDGFYDLQCNQVFIGMVTMQYQAQNDMVELIERLDNACIRFVHFSKENELRSRVFSEKMGLESGWNCHISLSSDTDGHATSQNLSEKNWHADKHDANVDRMKKNVDDNFHSLSRSKTLSHSAPGAINLEHTVVKFGNETRRSTRDHRNDSIVSPSQFSHKDFTVQEDGRSSPDSVLDSSPPDGCRSLSCLTDSTDHSAPVNFDMRNRAKLPRGIENIRPHIEQVDNVPLLVSLFTDCTANTARRMIGIMQDYNEVVCVMGSAANKDNMEIFMQADASIAVEPLYPVLCQKVSPYDLPSSGIGPIDLARILNSIPCSISLHREADVSLFSLVTMARFFMLCLWNSTQFWMSAACSITTMQLLSAVLALPMLLTVGNVMWLSIVIVPAISVALMCLPVDRSVMTRATYKHQNNLNVEICAFVLWCYGCKCLPAIILVLSTYGGMLMTFCHHISSVKNATECFVIYPNVKLQKGTELSYPEWGGWGDLYTEGYVLAQQFSFLMFFLLLVTISVSFVHREHLLWQKNVLSNKCWLICVVVLSGLHLAYFSVIVHYFNVDHDDITFQVPPHFIVIMVISPLLVLCINEFIKWQEIKVNLRYQRRARLDFGTKLGMNSPF